MSDQEIIRLLKQTRDLLAFHQELGLDELPRTAALENFLQYPSSGPARKRPAPPVDRRQMTSPASKRKPAPAAPAVSLAAIREETALCRQCPCGGRPPRIHGVGGHEAGLLIICDPPPADAPATPVAGPAAELLGKMLAAIGLARETVYVTSLFKCPLNREPAPEELQNCLALLRREIAAAAPRVLCAMGPLAASTLLRSKEPIFALRGRLQPFQNLALMATFHPAYLLKNPEMKKAAWLDLQVIRRELARR
jgi:DNA polymerase